MRECGHSFPHPGPDWHQLTSALDPPPHHRCFGSRRVAGVGSPRHASGFVVSESHLSLPQSRAARRDGPVFLRPDLCPLLSTEPAATDASAPEEDRAARADIPAPAAKSLKHRRGNLAALVESDRRIKNHRDHDLRIVQRRESRERSDVFRLRIRSRVWIDFLRGARLSRRRVAFQNRLAARALQHDFLHHGAHLGGRIRRDHAVRRARMKCDGLQRPSPVAAFRSRCGARPRRHRWRTSRSAPSTESARFRSPVPLRSRRSRLSTSYLEAS